MDPLTVMYLVGMGVAGAIGTVIRYRRRQLRRASELLALPSPMTRAETLNGFRVTHHREDVGERTLGGTSETVRVVAKVNGDGSVEARSVLIDALVERKDAEGLAAIEPACVPAGSVEAYLEALRLSKHPKAEAAALYFFEQRLEIGAALQAITAIGGRASIGPLLAYQQSVAGAYELNLDLTIEMVRARIAAEVGGERGRLAIAEGDEAGGLSLAESGTLSVTDEE